MATPIDKVYSLNIGVQGENIARAIQLDMTEWVNAYPDASYHVLFKPYNEPDAAPMVSTFENNILTWTPTLSATVVSGVGYTEIRALDPDTGLIRKSRIIPTSVENSVTGAEEDPPDPYTDWVNSVLAAGALANTRAGDSEAWAIGERNGSPVPSTDESYRNNSKWYKEQAEMSAINRGFFYVDVDSNGHLIYTRVDTMDDLVDFELDDGRLILWLERE